MYFSNQEKLAVLKALERIAKADDVMMQEEMDFLVRAATFLGSTAQDIEESKGLTMSEVTTTLTSMNEEQKSVILDMMIKLAATDGSIDQREMKEALRAFMKIAED